MFLVDANVLSEATKLEPDPRVLEWLARKAGIEIVDPFS
jgi:predicted nucleic acid-binding protein